MGGSTPRLATQENDASAFSAVSWIWKIRFSLVMRKTS
jgi:hypothetical protein